MGTGFLMGGDVETILFNRDTQEAEVTEVLKKRKDTKRQEFEGHSK